MLSREIRLTRIIPNYKKVRSFAPFYKLGLKIPYNKADMLMVRNYYTEIETIHINFLYYNMESYSTFSCLLPSVINFDAVAFSSRYNC